MEWVRKIARNDKNYKKIIFLYSEIYFFTLVSFLVSCNSPAGLDFGNRSIFIRGRYGVYPVLRTDFFRQSSGFERYICWFCVIVAVRLLASLGEF